jgi:steroid delta-isomerase-like uncharacterized protein
MDRTAIERLVHAWATQGVAEGHLATFDELLHPEIVDVSGGRQSRGVESFKQRAKAVADAFSQRTVTIDDLVVGEAHIAWRWTLRGTHSGPFMSQPPSNRAITLSGVNFQRLREGRVVEHWTLADMAGLLNQIRVQTPSLR